MKCLNCGREIANDSIYCEYCGKRVNVEVADKKGSKKKKIFCFSLLAVLFVSALSLFVYHERKEAVRKAYEIAQLKIEEERIAHEAEEEKRREEERCKLILPYLRQGYVDLGLPSGTLWKSQNEEGGYYGFNKALAKFGKNLPTEEQYRELISSCEWEWLGLEKGYKVVGPNGGNVIFPTEGYIAWGWKYWPRSSGSYLSSTKCDSIDHYIVSTLRFTESRVNISGFCEYPREGKDVFRCSVRLVQNPFESSLESSSKKFQN